MRRVSACEEKCCLLSGGRCKALTVSTCEGNRCAFYKPEGCEDMVRVIRNEIEYLATAEELGLVRCKSCKFSRLSREPGKPIVCLKMPDAKFKVNSYCSMGKKR